jgi:hypothetical protein
MEPLISLNCIFMANFFLLCCVMRGWLTDPGNSPRLACRGFACQSDSAKAQFWAAEKSMPPTPREPGEFPALFLRLIPACRRGRFPLRKVAMRWKFLLLYGLAGLIPLAVSAQIDPFKRDLIQFGYDQAAEGKQPVAAYAYYYRNDPGFIETNLTLRLAVAPTYLDSELGFAHLLGPQTDLGIGMAGGGFADNYNEIRAGKWIEGESYDGYGGELSVSLYHLFNPGQLIPLNLVVRGTTHYSVYARDETAAAFQLPDDGANTSFRTGLRYGGIEPTLFPDLAMELSAWYEGQYRTDSGSYGFNGDREIESVSHLFWGSAALSYTWPQTKQNIFVRIVAGTSLNADRLSAYRLGGYLPLSAEYPLSLPGYFFQEFSARDFALINASYIVPIAPDQRWNLEFNGATANIDYLSSDGQNGNWVSGVGAGVLYRSPSDKFKVVVAYAYGVDAIRASGRGANSVSVLFQLDLGRFHSSNFNSAQPNRWQGWNWLMGR